MNRLGGIHIPDELKKRAICSHCKKSIAGSVKDPVISAPSLGKGAYHTGCADLLWKKMKEEENAEEEKKRSKGKK